MQSFEIWLEQTVFYNMSPEPGRVPVLRESFNKHLEVLFPAMVQIKKLESRPSFSFLM